MPAVNLRGPKVFRFIAIAVLALSSLAALAQTTLSTGSIQGTVTELSGAAVPGAKVTITNRFTGRVITVATTTAGAYASGALAPGTYRVRVEAQGFKTSELPLTIEAGVTASGNMKLQVGETKQVIEVSPPQVNTEQATIQAVLTSQQLESVPINGRNFFDLAQLEPGVQLQDGTSISPTKNGLSSASLTDASQEACAWKWMAWISATKKWVRPC